VTSFELYFEPGRHIGGMVNVGIKWVTVRNYVLILMPRLFADRVCRLVRNSACNSFWRIRKFATFAACVWCTSNMAAVTVVDTMTSLSTRAATEIFQSSDSTVTVSQKWRIRNLAITLWNHRLYLYKILPYHHYYLIKVYFCSASYKTRAEALKNSM